MSFSAVTTKIKTSENSTKDWFGKGFKDQGSFTDDEYHNIVEPYWTWLETHRGFISYEVTFPDDLTKVIKLTCDTLDNLMNILAVTTNGGDKDNQHPLFRGLMDLIASKNIDKIHTVQRVQIIDNSTNTTINFG